ncbi:hypothetical protein DFH27DRAFT_3718 [Peziza echinospora]|nr:hypothetical protein DFH27DRAFT_3718 [Peziza echinospora]
MAPQPNGAIKRKRPEDASGKEKKDSSTKTLETGNKRIKPDAQAGTQPPKKGPSNALPVAPLAVSSLKAPGKEEASFPRGGASLLTPLEYKEVTNQAMKDVLFETAGTPATKSSKKDADGDVAMIGGEGKKTKQKKRRAEDAKGTKTQEDAGPRVEGLSYKRIVPGSIVLGCVTQINSTDIQLALPNNLFGYVPITSISEKLTKNLETILEAVDESGDEKEDGKEDEKIKSATKSTDDLTNLQKYFWIGQYLRACIVASAEETTGKTSAEHSKQKKKHIELSLQPSMANARVTKKELVIGAAIQASVTSVEDHGLIMSLGLEDNTISGFISSKELGNHLTLAEVQEGQVLLCTITGLASNGKIVKLSADAGKPIGAKKGKGSFWKGGLWLEEAPTIDTFTVGTGVQLLVTDVGKNGGLQGKLMGMVDGVIDYFHVHGWNEEKLEDRIKIGNKINARVLFTNPNSDDKRLNLSILPHILNLGSYADAPKAHPTKALPIGTILPAAKIIAVNPKLGAFVDTGVTGTPGFVHISRLSDKKVEDLSATLGPFKVGNTHAARIVGFNAADGLFIVSMEQKIIDQKYLRADDVKVGEVVKATISKLLPSGAIIVTLSDGITAVVEEMHLSDVKLKNPEKKFREGMTVTGRVILNDPSRRQLRLTLKKTLVNSDAPIITSYESAIPGTQTPGTLVAITPKGAVVKFYSDVTAFLPVREMSEAFIRDPREHFRVGQSVNVHILEVDVENEKMRVSCKDPKFFGEPQQNALAALKVGQIVSGIVAEKSSDDLVVELQDVGADGLKGVLSISHLVDGSPQKAAQAFKNMRAGQLLKDMAIIKKVEGKRLILLSMKPAIVNSAKEGKILNNAKDVTEGETYTGYVTNITLHSIILRFFGGANGAISKSDIPDDQAALPDFGVTLNQVIKGTCNKIDLELNRFNLTLKPYAKKQATTEKPSVKEKSVSKAEIPVSKAVLETPVSNPLDESITTVADISVGKITKAKILSVKETQINIQLAEGVHGRVDVTQLFDSWSDIKNKKRPLASFKKDQILDVKILGIHDARNHRFLPITHKTSHTKAVFELTAKPSDCVEGADNVLTFESLKEGSEVVAFVNNHAADCIYVSLSPSVRGRISMLDLSDDAGALKDINRSFPIGSALKCKVTRIDMEKKKLELSARKTPVTYETIEKGMLLPAKVTKVTEQQVVVQLMDNIVGTINLTDIADDYSLVSLSNFTQNDIIRVSVIDVDAANKRVMLSCRPSRVLSSSTKITDPEILTPANINTGDVRRGFVTSITDKGIFVLLGGLVSAFVRVSDISDFFVKDWKSVVKVQQLVRGKITSIDKALGHIQMSLKGSVIDGVIKPQIHLNELEVGQVVKGTIRSAAEYGVFVVVDNSANVSGLCHKSEISDTPVKDLQKLYSSGDQVKAKILSIDLEKKKISFGLKASYFEDESEDEDEDDEDVEGSEDESVAGGVDLETAVEYDSDAEDAAADDASDDEMEDAPPLNASTDGALSTGGFDWTGSILDANPNVKAEDSDASDSETGVADKKKKKKSAASKIKQDMTGDLNTRAPESVSDFERLLMGNPQSSELWVRYMAFQLQLSDIEKAREVSERALKTITTNLKEKEFVWAAMLNMELEFGSDETLDEVFKRACIYNDSLEMHERLCSIYIQAGKFDKADSLYQVALKKHGAVSPQLWTTYATFLFSAPTSAPDRARALLPRAIQALPKQPESIHRTLISKFAQLEFTRGDPERGRTIFENLTSTYPAKTDLLMVWVDMEMKLAKESGEKKPVRDLLERKLVAGGKVKAKPAKTLFKRWLAWEEKSGDRKGIENVSRRAREFAEAAVKEKVNKDRKALIKGEDESGSDDE